MIDRTKPTLRVQVAVVFCAMLTMTLTGCGIGSASGNGKATPTSTPRQRYELSQAQKARHFRDYARGLLPRLRRSAPAFACAVQFASTHSSGDLNGACAQQGKDLNLSEQEVDGVPHPYAWYTPIGWLHHRVMGIFHEIRGGITSWQTGAENSDSGTQGTAVADMARARDELNSMIVEVWRDGYR